MCVWRVEGGGGGDLFLIKELVTVTLVLAAATNNNQDPRPLKPLLRGCPRRCPPLLPFLFLSEPPASQVAREPVIPRFHPEEQVIWEKGRG